MPATGLLNPDALNPNVSPSTRTVQKDELSSYQMEKMTGKDSVMRQRAEAYGKNYSTGRGLLDSSIGAEAAFGSFVDRAAPLAMADADRYGKVADQNLGYENQFKLSDKNFAQQGLLQKDNQAWQTGERVGSQTFSAGENALDRTLQKDLQTGEFTWRSGENAQDRTLQKDLQQSDQTWRSGESLADRIMTMSENEKNRVLEQYLQKTDQTFRAGENAADRLLTMSEAEKNRLLETAMQDKDQTWRTGEAGKDRDLTREQSAADRLLTMSENEKNRLLEQVLQSSDQNWRTGENAADRILTMSEAEKNRVLEQALQQQDQGWRTGEADKDRTTQNQMLDKQQGFAAEQNALDRTLSREELESRERTAVEQSKAEIEKLGYALQLDQMQLSASSQNQIQTMLLSQILAIQNDGNLDPKSKEIAIENARSAAAASAKAITDANKTKIDTPGAKFNKERASEVLVKEANRLGYTNPNMAELNRALEYAEANNLTEEQMRAYVRELLPTEVAAQQQQRAAQSQPTQQQPTQNSGSHQDLIALAAQYNYNATPEEAASVAAYAKANNLNPYDVVMNEMRARGLA